MPPRQNDPEEADRHKRLLAGFRTYVRRIQSALAARDERGSGRRIAELAGVAPSTINKVMKRDVPWSPKWQTLDRLVQATGIPVPPELIPGYPNLPDEIGRDRPLSFANNGHDDDLAGEPEVDNLRVRIMRLVLELDDGDLPTVERILAGLASRSPPEAPRRLPPPKAGS